MDELLYFIALAVGIVGTYYIWKYAREKRKKTIQKLGPEDKR